MAFPGAFWEERLVRPVDVYPEHKAEGTEVTILDEKDNYQTYTKKISEIDMERFVELVDQADVSTAEKSRTEWYRQRGVGYRCHLV